MESQQRIARWVSVIGHPFLLMPLLTGLIAYRLLPPHEALVAECIALGVVIVPAAIFTFIKVKQGAWNNLDVSDPAHRSQFYGMLMALLALLTALAWVADVPRSIAFGTTAVLSLVALASVLNKHIKASLHTGFSVFVTCVMYLIHPPLVLLALLLSVAVAWSRIVLRRHTLREVILGAALGTLVGGLFVLSQLASS